MIQMDWKLFWEGRLNTNKVGWKLHSGSAFLLSEELEAKRDEIWNDTKQNFPGVYDGKLLLLDGYTVGENDVQLNLREIQFSQVLTIEKTGNKLEPFGTVGVQMLILSPDGRFLLYGKRAKDLLHCPLFLAPPGGMFSGSDIKYPFTKASMREINEEVQLELQDEKYLVGICADLYTQVGTILVLLAYSKQTPDISQSVPGNEEWDGHQLHWHSVETLENLEYTNLLEGLVFAKKDWKKQLVTGTSIIWGNEDKNRTNSADSIENQEKSE
jgi:hypothetical protein